MKQHPLYDRLCWICRAYMDDHPDFVDKHKCSSCGFTVRKGLIVDIKLYISMDEVLMKRIKYEDLSKEQQENINTLVPRVNMLLQKFYTENPGVTRRNVSSGYRPPDINKAVGGAKASNHMICAAVDLVDVDCKLKQWTTEDILKEFDLYMEHPDSSPTWEHLQCKPPASGHRVFKP